MLGKEKCKMLKEIRREIAKQNDISFFSEECQYRGNCKGTCPKCESEVAYLERELAKRKALGKKVVLAGISTCMVLGVSGCVEDIGGYQTEGSMPHQEEYNTTVADTTEDAKTEETTFDEGKNDTEPESTEEIEGKVKEPETVTESELEGEAAVTEED